MFGRFSVWILLLIAEGPMGGVAVVTDGLWTAVGDHAPAGASSSGTGALGCAVTAGQGPEIASTGCRIQTRSRASRGPARPCGEVGARSLAGGALASSA